MEKEINSEIPNYNLEWQELKGMEVDGFRKIVFKGLASLVAKVVYSNNNPAARNNVYAVWYKGVTNDLVWQVTSEILKKRYAACNARLQSVLENI